jgi:sugar lactone lactonase YvrE
MSCNIFDRTQCELGEGAVWLPRRSSFVWLDILSRKLFEKSNSGLTPAVVYDLQYTASAILIERDQSPSTVLLVADSGVYQFDLDTGESHVKHQYSLPASHRTNDAGIDPMGRVVFGVMEWEPSGLNGWLSRIDLDGNIDVLMDGVGIPNTFVWSDDGSFMYFADSYLQKMYSANYSIGLSGKVVLFSLDGGATPDGSELVGEYLYNAEWDGGRVTKRSIETGKVVAFASLPVPRPTSCAFGSGSLIVTTAKANLTQSQLEKWPCSGMTFLISLDEFEVGVV